jgi:hypothetical protein
MAELPALNLNGYELEAAKKKCFMVNVAGVSALVRRPAGEDELAGAWGDLSNRTVPRAAGSCCGWGSATGPSQHRNQAGGCFQELNTEDPAKFARAASSWRSR